MTDIGSLRKQLGLTQTQLARLVGLTESTISHVENGKPHSNRARNKIIQALTELQTRPTSGRVTLSITVLLSSGYVSITTDADLNTLPDEEKTFVLRLFGIAANWLAEQKKRPGINQLAGEDLLRGDSPGSDFKDIIQD